MIYFMQRGWRDLIKIGYTRMTVEKRFAGVRSSVSPDRLTILGTMPGTFDTEEALHKKFCQHKYPGAFEWFYPVQELRDFIQENATPYEAIERASKRRKR